MSWAGEASGRWRGRGTHLGFQGPEPSLSARPCSKQAGVSPRVTLRTTAGATPCYFLRFASKRLRLAEARDRGTRGQEQSEGLLRREEAEGMGGGVSGSIR